MARPSIASGEVAALLLVIPEFYGGYKKYSGGSILDQPSTRIRRTSLNLKSGFHLVQ